MQKEEGGGQARGWDRSGGGGFSAASGSTRHNTTQHFTTQHCCTPLHNTSELGFGRIPPGTHAGTWQILVDERMVGRQLRREYLCRRQCCTHGCQPPRESRRAHALGHRCAPMLLQTSVTQLRPVAWNLVHAENQLSLFVGGYPVSHAVDRGCSVWDDMFWFQPASVNTNWQSVRRFC